jgi:hypothetical protein
MSGHGPAAGSALEPGSAMAVVTVGLRAHTGWAVAVSLAGPPPAPTVVDRRRLDLTDPDLPRQAFHAAAGLDPAAAADLIERAAASAEAIAVRVLRDLVAELRAAGHPVAGTGIALGGGGRQPGTLAAVLASHPAMHAAEGELYREALLRASNACGLPVTGVPERDLPDRAAADLGLPVPELRGRLVELGRDSGPPWAQDQRSAALAAWLALLAAGAGHGA